MPTASLVASNGTATNRRLFLPSMATMHPIFLRSVRRPCIFIFITFINMYNMATCCFSAPWCYGTSLHPKVISSLLVSRVSRNDRVAELRQRAYLEKTQAKHNVQLLPVYKHAFTLLPSTKGEITWRVISPMRTLVPLFASGPSYQNFEHVYQPRVRISAHTWHKAPVVNSGHGGCIAKRFSKVGV